MAHILTMPRQGNTVESCIITEWKVEVGDTVTAESIVCGVETDKAAFEVAAGAEGTVLELLYKAGDEVPVLQPIAIIGAPGEDGQAAISPSNDISGISPRARKLAEKEKVSVTFSGSGPGGRIIERDVMAALPAIPALPAENAAEGTAAIPAGAVTETAITGIRKIISDRMRSSLAESAQLTLNASAPAAKLLEFRSGIKSQSGMALGLTLSEITINDLILFAVARTLPRFPYMNAHKNGDTIKTFEQIHLAVAVDTPRGLMVPVIRNADLLSLLQIYKESRRLAEACQSGAVNPDELSGSTFTVSNLGSFGITSFTPVLNPPEVAILGICAIEMKSELPPASGFAPYIGFSLTINHEAVDGAPAARFLKALSEAIKHIDLLLAAG